MALSQLLFLRLVLIMTGSDSHTAFVSLSALDLEADLSNAEILKPQWNSMCKTSFLCVQTKNKCPLGCFAASKPLTTITNPPNVNPTMYKEVQEPPTSTLESTPPITDFSSPV